MNSSTITITITEKNRARIEAAIAEVQAGARSRLIDANDVLAAAAEFEARLAAAGIPVKHRKGATAIYGPHTVARSYGHTAHGTVATMERTTAGWRLTGIKRTYTSDRPHPALPDRHRARVRPRRDAPRSRHRCLTDRPMRLASSRRTTRLEVGRTVRSHPCQGRGHERK